MGKIVCDRHFLSSIRTICDRIRLVQLLYHGLGFCERCSGSYRRPFSAVRVPRLDNVLFLYSGVLDEGLRNAKVVFQCSVQCYGFFVGDGVGVSATVSDLSAIREHHLLACYSCIESTAKYLALSISASHYQCSVGDYSNQYCGCVAVNALGCVPLCQHWLPLFLH